MTDDKLIELARKAGINAESDTLCRYEGWVGPLKQFAALVLANNPPQSSMAWQEGFEAGKQIEREACARISDERMGPHNSVSSAIRARGKNEQR